MEIIKAGMVPPLLIIVFVPVHYSQMLYSIQKEVVEMEVPIMVMPLSTML